MAKVLFVLTSHDRLGDTCRHTGFYVSEAAHPWHELTQAGVEVTIASVQGGAPPQDGYDPEDAIQRAFLADPTVAEQLADTVKLADVDPGEFDAVLFVGGHGTMWDLPDNPDVQRIIRELHEGGDVVAAVCHGPAALLNARLSDGRYLVDGRTVAAFTDSEEAAVGLTETVPFMLASELESRGARHTSAANFHAHVEVDGRLITGQNPASAGPVGSAIVRALTAGVQA
ncbi:MAG: type 1 glutamine amidotransferase domain-containing protein [Solirubrobacteraceae bacterium]